jgi:hypothetical protein
MKTDGQPGKENFPPSIVVEKNFKKKKSVFFFDMREEYQFPGQEKSMFIFSSTHHPS